MEKYILDFKNNIQDSLWVNIWKVCRIIFISVGRLIIDKTSNFGLLKLLGY